MAALTTPAPTTGPDAATSELPYLGLLRQHRDFMVTYLVTKFGVSEADAALIIDQLENRWINRLVEDYAHLDVDLPLARLILNEALGFLQLCTMERGHGPSPLVDLGWHTMILYTREYTALCVALGGHFIHHGPTDVVGIDLPALTGPVSDGPSLTGTAADVAPGFTLADTLAAMRRYGPANELLWTDHSGCDGCCGNRCNDTATAKFLEVNAGCDGCCGNRCNDTATAKTLVTAGSDCGSDCEAAGPHNTHNGTRI
jgi:hypothetical protein